jgi:hypothetical protein
MLGPSQKAILAWIKDHPRSSTEDIGNALYDITSMCAQGNTHPNRQRWALRILHKLKQDILVESHGGETVWEITEEGKRAL